MGIPAQVSILNMIKQLLVSEPNKNSSCISLWEVEQLRRKQYSKITLKKNEYEEQMVELMVQAHNTRYLYTGSSFNALENEMTISFYHNGKWENIFISKKPCNVYGNIFVKKIDSIHAQEYLELLGSVLSELYNFYIQYWQFYYQSSYDVKSVNSRFLVDISDSKSSITFGTDFKLKFSSFEDVSCMCPDDVLAAITGKEEEILKKVFVKIKDCPEWMQPILREIRQKELEELQSGETEKQKRMEFINRFFPFI